MTEPAASKRIARADLIKAAAFTIAWLIPMGLSGLIGYPPEWLPTRMRDIYSVSCLFDDRPTRHSSFYVQLRYEDSPAFVEWEESDFFRMQPFGHRTRFDRYMSRYGWRKNDKLARKQLAEWIATRHAKVHPDRAPVVAVRFLFVDTLIDGGEAPQGHWEKPRCSTLPPSQLHRVGRPIWIEDGKAVERGGP